MKVTGISDEEYLLKAPKELHLSGQCSKLIHCLVPPAQHEVHLPQRISTSNFLCSKSFDSEDEAATYRVGKSLKCSLTTNKW